MISYIICEIIKKPIREQATKFQLYRRGDLPLGKIVMYHVIFE
jgi:hypothetical protein